MNLRPGLYSMSCVYSKLCHRDIHCPTVTKQSIAKLLYLNYKTESNPITVYTSSSGTSTASRQPVGFETKAFAIVYAMKHDYPLVHTCIIAQEFGTVVILLPSGERGNEKSDPVC